MLRQAATIIGIGLVIGLTVTFVAAESLSKLLYGITARDAVSFTVAPLLIAVVGAAACVIPARRAARVSPVLALRSRSTRARFGEAPDRSGARCLCDRN